MNQDTRFFYKSNYESVFDRCYIGDQNGFKLLARLPHKTAAAASLVYNDTMWLTGGFDPDRLTIRNSQRCYSWIWKANNLLIDWQILFCNAISNTEQR